MDDLARPSVEAQGVHKSWDETKGAETSPSERPSLPLFFKGKGILVTGGTGFLGKVLIEKLLRCCPGVGDIFVLLRPNQKTGKTAEQRLKEEVLGSKCFDRLRSSWPGFSARCKAVHGDVALPDMGMSAADLECIQVSVSVVFHCAATVKFNEHLKTAFRVNVDGVSNLVAVCKSLRRLDAVVHVSTAYVHAPDHSSNLILEQLPALPVGHAELQQRVQRMTAEEVEEQTESILASAGMWPNSYCLTKALAEHSLFDARHRGLPLVVVRPSIVTCALAEPCPGWIDSLVGPAGLVLAVALGALHVAPGGQDKIVDFVPVDLVINALLAAAWYEGTGRGRAQALGREGPMIVHCGTSGRNPISWQFMLQAMPPYYQRHPSPKAFGPIFFRWVKTDTAYRALHALTHVAPALASDILSVLRGRKPGMRRQVHRMTTALSALTYFAHHEWRFDTSNAERIAAELPADHYPSFAFDFRGLIWDVYFMVWCHGMKVYLLQEEPSYLRRSKL